MSLQASMEVLSVQPFRWFALNELFANLGNGINYIVMSWVVLNSNRPVSALAILMMCFWLPTIFLGPFCGALLERLPKRWVLAFSNTSRGILLIFVIAIPFINYPV